MTLRPDPPQGPDYRLYKSEPELTTVAEVDESNGEEKSEQAAEKESSTTKGELECFFFGLRYKTSFIPQTSFFYLFLFSVPYPVGIVSPRTKSPVPVSSTIASYVTLRKTKKPEPKKVGPFQNRRRYKPRVCISIHVI